MKRRSLIRKWCRSALLGFVIIIFSLTVAGFGGAFFWSFDLFSHFRLQYACALTLLIIGLALSRCWIVGSVALLALVLNVFEVGRLYVNPGSQGMKANGPSLRLIQLNAWHVRNRDPKLIAEYIRSCEADVVLIQETSPAIIALLDDLYPHYRWAAQPDHANPARSAVLINAQQSMWELTSVGDVEITAAEYESVTLGTAIQVTHAGQRVAILHAHVTAPGSRGRHAARQTEFKHIADWVRQNAGNAIVIGDLNSTPWCASFRSLLSHTALVNSQQGFGFQGTWPRRPPDLLTWMFRIPIDHCLHSASMATTDRRVGPYVGSDHFPLAVTLRALSSNV